MTALHAVAGAATGHPKWWSQAYFGEVARRVDQVAVMSYDTAMPLPSLYSGYVAQQTALALEATPTDVGLLMGLPAYYADQVGHRGSAETVAAALRGVRLGLSRTAAGRPAFGVAVYADFTATPADWAAYRDLWCQDSSYARPAAARCGGRSGAVAAQLKSSSPVRVRLSSKKSG